MLVSGVNATGYELASLIPTPVVIRVTDQRGLPVPNVKVLFTPDNYGSVTPNAVMMSDGEGNVVTQWTLGAIAGRNTLVVSAPDVPSIAALAITTTTVAGPIARVVINPPAATIAQGSTLRLDGYGADTYGNRLNGTPISWSSSDPSVATVSGGLVAAAGPGLATISATYIGFVATTLVSVPVPTGPGGAGIPLFSIATTVDNDLGITVLRSDGTVESRITCGTACEYLTRPNWSRDGSKLSLTGKRGDLSVLFVANRDGSDLHEVASTPKLRILTSKGSFDHWPQFHEDWSVDERLVYVRAAVSATSIETVRADGSGRNTIMTTSGVFFTGDLLRLVNTRWGLGDAMITARIDQQLTAMDPDGTNARRLAAIGFDEHVWSPDGTTIAFVTGHADHATISLVDPISASVRTINVPSAGSVCWSPNSLEFSMVSLEPVSDRIGSAQRQPFWQSISTIRHDGTGLRKVVPVLMGWGPLTHSWSPDSKFIIYPDDRSLSGGANGPQLYAQSIDQGTNTRISDIVNVNFFTIAGARCLRGIN